MEISRDDEDLEAVFGGLRGRGGDSRVKFEGLISRS